MSTVRHKLFRPNSHQLPPIGHILLQESASLIESGSRSILHPQQHGENRRLQPVDIPKPEELLA